MDPGSCQPTGMGIALVVEAGDGEIDVMPETDVTAKTVLGEPAKGSADQSDLQDIGGCWERRTVVALAPRSHGPSWWTLLNRRSEWTTRICFEKFELHNGQRRDLVR